MVDFDVRRMKKLSFMEVFIELLVIAVGLFLANRWNTLLTETINTYFPSGVRLGEKIVFNVILTIMLVWIVFYTFKLINKREKI